MNLKGRAWYAGDREKNKGVRGIYKPGLRCYNCREEGHVKVKCPKPKDKSLLCSIKTSARDTSARGVYCKGSVEGRQSAENPHG